jgi:ABC-type transporter Mla MlaB component
MVEVTSTDLLHQRISGSPTLQNAKEACDLLNPVFAELEATRAQANGPRTIEISLAGVTNGNSVLVSLMLVWMRRSRKADVSVLFTDIPPLVSNLIEFTGLDDVLPVVRTGVAA